MTEKKKKKKDEHGSIEKIMLDKEQKKKHQWYLIRYYTSYKLIFVYNFSLCMDVILNEDGKISGGRGIPENTYLT